MQKSEKRKIAADNQNIKRFIGVGIIVDYSTKKDIILKSDLLDKLHVEKILNSQLIRRVEDLPYGIYPGFEFFSLSTAKEVEEFKDDIGSQVCNLINDFIARYKCEKLFKKPEFIIGLKVEFNPNLPENREERAIERKCECSKVDSPRVGEFKIKNWTFKDEKNCVYKDLPLRTLGGATATEKVLSLMENEVWFYFSPTVHRKLNEDIKELREKVKRGISVNDFYEEYEKILQETLHFGEEIFELRDIKSLYKPELEEIRGFFESKVSTEVQKSVEKSTKATRNATIAIAVSTGVMALAAFL